MPSRIVGKRRKGTKQAQPPKTQRRAARVNAGDSNARGDESEPAPEDLWRSLTNDHIGFYTGITASTIPERPGIYAWFFPLDLTGEPDQLLKLTRCLLSYDAKVKGIGTRTTRELSLSWDPLEVTLSRDVTVSSSRSRQTWWNNVAKQGHSSIQRLATTLHISSIFARPLYVGLTNDLSRRYDDHVQGRGSAGTFHKRFVEFSEQLLTDGYVSSKPTVRQLLFACVPAKRPRDEVGAFEEDQINLAEDILKQICQPVFGEK